MKNSNQPAFPVNASIPMHEGLTKREYFAGLALQGLIASCAHPMAVGSNLESYPKLPREAVEMADALLKEL